MDEAGLRTAYERDGHVFPLEAMSQRQAAEYRTMFESAEATHASDPTASRMMKGFANIVLPFVDEIMRLPTVIEPIRTVLGDDLLVIGANFFVKEPSTPDFVSWHQDLTYWGYDNAQEVTAWVALSEATPNNGCMRFISGSHRNGIVGHRDTFDDFNLLSRGQEIAVAVNEADAVDVVLRPGEMSLHHGHLFHASNPNTTAGRRIGLVLRYVTPTMKQLSGDTMFAQLVAGEDRFGNFELLPRPTAVMAEVDVANARRAIAAQDRVGYAGATDRGKRLT